MDAGSIFAEVVCVAAVLAGGAWVVWQMKLGRGAAVGDGTWRTPWGEIVEVPREAKAGARISREGEDRKASTGQHAHGHRIAPRSEDAR